MASLIYNSLVEDVANGNVVLGVDTFYAMLVTSGYTPDKDAHTRRSDITNEVTGTGYTAGGAASACTVTLDTSTDRTDASFADVSWTVSSFTARGAVIYKHRGGSSSADEIVAYVDFGADQTSSAGTFLFHPTSPLRFQN